MSAGSIHARCVRPPCAAPLPPKQNRTLTDVACTHLGRKHIAPVLLTCHPKFPSGSFFSPKNQHDSVLAFSSLQASETSEEENAYGFLDDGDYVEVRVSVPNEFKNFSSEQLGINIHDDSLLVTISTMDNLFPLIVAQPLYSSIKSSESVWYKEDEEIVLSLKKRNPLVTWPKLIRNIHSLGNGVSKSLNNCSIYFVGENTSLNFQVAQQIASVTGYVPLQTQQLIEAAVKRPVSQIWEEEGSTGVEEIELQIIQSLSTNVRCCVGTLGDGLASSRNAENWKFIHAAVTVYLSSKEISNIDTCESYSQADVAVGFDPSESFSSEAIKNIAEDVLMKLKVFLESDPELPKRKLLYVRMGCQGDWRSFKDRKEAVNPSNLDSTSRII